MGARGGKELLLVEVYGKDRQGILTRLRRAVTTFMTDYKSI